MKTITYQSWKMRYLPLKNHKQKDAPHDGAMFETSGEQFKFVQKHIGERKIWTLINTDDGERISPGFHVVNRIGYFICRKPYTNPNLEVKV